MAKQDQISGEIVTKKRLATLLGLNERRITYFVEIGAPVYEHKKSGNLFNTADFFSWYVDFEKAREGPEAERYSKNKEDAEIRVLEARALEYELRNEKAMGNLVTAQAVEEAVTERNILFLQKLEKIPRDFPRKTRNKTPKEAAVILKEQVNQIIKELEI